MDYCPPANAGGSMAGTNSFVKERVRKPSVSRESSTLFHEHAGPRRTPGVSRGTNGSREIYRHPTQLIGCDLSTNIRLLWMLAARRCAVAMDRKGCQHRGSVLAPSPG